MALQTITTIKIGETIISNFTSLEIIQRIHDHHSFSFEVRRDLLVNEYKSIMPASQLLYGERVSIEIKPIDGLEDLIIGTDPDDYIMQFYGIISGVAMQKSQIKDIEETFVIKGHSLSILLEGGARFNSFVSMPLQDIVSKAKEGYDIDMDIRPFYKKNLSYTVQYDESTFEFLNRLAKRHGEWFYYNGRTAVFGTPGGAGGQPKLVSGINMHDFSYEMQLVPSNFKVIENDNRKGDYTADETLKYRKEADGFHQNFINKSNKVFNQQTLLQINQNAVGGQGSSTLENYTANKIRSVMGGMMKIEALSEVPGVTVGSTVRISGIDMQLESSYRVTQITHTCDDGGGYENRFTAVNFNGSLFSPQTDPDLVPYCKSQTAVVIGNTDPDGLSGVQVQMPWQEAIGQSTPYIPLVQKYGGSERGSHIIPEIGDTVFVDFQGGNAELPIVVGTMTSRNEKSGFSTPNNDIKALKSRSGITVTLNDADGSVLIEDPSGNKCLMDGNGSMSFDAPKNIDFNAGENININAGQNMNTTVGFNKTNTVGGNYTEEIAGSKFLNIGMNFMMNVIGNVFEFIKGNKETESKDIKKRAKEIFISSTEENITILGAKNVNNHSGENSTNG